MEEQCTKCNKNISTEEYIENGGYCKECMDKIENGDYCKEELGEMGITEDITKENKKVSFREAMKEVKLDTYKRIMKNTENMILTTTNDVKGYNIIEYIGIVAGTDIYLIGGVFGGGMANQENLYTDALSRAISNLRQNAEVMGANGVIGIQSNITSTGGTNSLILTLTGTAVKIEK